LRVLLEPDWTLHSYWRREKAGKVNEGMGLFGLTLFHLVSSNSNKTLALHYLGDGSPSILFLSLPSHPLSLRLKGLTLLKKQT
jgi:hypothetical protein